MRSFKRMTAFLLAAAGALSASRTVQAEDLLTIGSAAPQLNVEHWVQNGNGKFKPVTKFESGKVYVVEFWATWCGPCIQSMPHLAELQKKYADKGVQLISISDEDLDTVEKFLDREVRAPKGGAAGKEAADGEKAEKTPTYRDLTSVYCLTTDPDQSSNKDYMEAAEQNGIPTAFIVGKDSKIEWIGHPMEMDQPLADVVADKWDRAAYLKVLVARKEAEKAMEQLSELMQNEKFDEAIKLLDGLIAKTPSDELKFAKLQILLIAKKTDEATAWTETLFKDLADKPEMVNMVAWSLYEMTEQEQLKSPAMIDLAIKASEAALKSAPEDTKASALDTIAHLYAIKGDKKKALELEEQAVKLATGQDLEFMQQFLEELKAELKEGKDK